MKKIEVRPEKVRGMGNLIPPLSVSDFELSDCMIHEEDPFKINGHLFNHFSIDVPVVPVNLVLSTNVATIYPDATTPNTAVITATLTDSSDVPVPNVDVYFQEEGVRIGTASTNAQGACTFEYSNSSGGTHTIRAYTVKQGKYNKSSAEINVNVYMPTSLSLSPVSTSANTVDIVTLSSKIIDQNDLPLGGKLIDLYRGDVKIKSAYSNSKGIVDFPIRVTDLGKTNTVLTCTTDKTSVTVDENVLCILYLKDNQNNPLANKTVYCEDWSKTTNDEGRVIFNYANPSTGEVTKVFKFDGDNLYNGASVTAKWTVVPAENPPVLVLESVGDLVGETGDLITFNLDSSEHLNLGETVQLINIEDNSVLDSCTVKSQDNNLTYTCTGKGDVGVKAKLARGTEVSYSNVLNLEDCIIYEPYTEEFHNSHTVPDGMGYSFSEKGILVTGSGNLLKCDVPLTDAFVAEVTFNGHGTGDYFKPISIFESSDGKIAFVAFNQNRYIYGNTNKGQTTANYNYSAGTTAKIIITTNSVSTYYNNVLIRSDSFTDLFNSPYYYGIYINNDGKNGYVKDLKIKPYTE